jgi:hypothetical protein
MSITSLAVTLERIAWATPDSKIAVFKGKNGMFDSVFANTALTAKKLKMKDKRLIGVFDCTMCKTEVMIALVN